MKLQELLKLNTIGKRFLIPTLLFTVILFGGLGAFLVVKNNDTVQFMIESKGKSTASLLAEISAPYILNYDLTALEGFVRQTLNDPEVAFVVFYDHENKPLTEQSKVPDDGGLKLLRYEKEIKDSSGRVLGALNIGYSRKNLSQNLLNGIKYVAMSTTSALILLALGMTFLFRGITRPIGELIGIIDQVAQGNLTVAVSSEVLSTGDEVGVAANAFTQMTLSLRGVIKKIQDASRQITSVADLMFLNTKKVNDGAAHQAKATEKTSTSIEEMNASVRSISDNIDGLSSSAETTSASVGEMSSTISHIAESTVTLNASVEGTVASLMQMSSSIKQVAEHTELLTADAENTTSSITEMNASIKEVGNNAKEAAMLTEKVSQDAAELGSVAIEKTIAGMEKIKKTVDKSSDVINKLGERTEHIGTILTVIDEVTRQTNLLALNAAILAAQAGAEGKGFAVVADEIKSLADRTASSTKEIADLIHHVQTETKDAITSTNEGSQSVTEGLRLSINARESLHKILASSKRSSEMSRQIERAAFEQIKATTQVTELMEKMNTMVQQISAAMKELEKGTLHITTASENMKSITQQVKSSTEEQAKGSKQISREVENMTARIQQIARAMNEQRNGHEIITKSIIEIHEITQLSVQTVQQMNQAAEGLTAQANQLKAEVHHFKI